MLFCSNLSAASNWGERIKNWFPDFIAEWWWPEAESERSETSVASLENLPAAAGWLEFPSNSNNNQNFHWPLTSLTPELDAKQRLEAEANTEILQDKSSFLPIPAGTPIRLISGEDGVPDFFQHYLQTFSPLINLNYKHERDQDFIAIARPGLLNVLYVRANEVVAEENPWYYDFNDQQLILVYEGDPANLKIRPEKWSILSTKGGNAIAEMTAARRLFEAANGEQALLTYADPITLGFDPEKLEKVDYYINRAIRRRATPGAQLLVAKQGKIVYQKSYGYHTYRRQQEVYTSDLYDLASVTKAAATSLAVMHLYEKGELELDKKAVDYLPELKRRAAGRHTIEQLLTHQTGLQANLPVQKYLGRSHVSDEQKEEFSIPLAPDRWLDETVPAEIIKNLRNVNHTRRRIYRYSDVNYVLLQQIVERIDGRPIDQLLQEEIYGPLGLQRLSYLPHNNFGPEQCVPTVKDNWMRGGLLRGYVHDEGAALLGGVAGHAGLFATATDLAQLFQMLINKGNYNGHQIFSPETVEKFTSRSRLNYRALGFDRVAAGWPGLVKEGASEATFGHTGFSGTCVWADPENELVFVLLTNRIHPDPNNKKLMKLNTRGKAHRQIYRSILDPKA